jgi:hypothetical protein
MGPLVARVLRIDRGRTVGLGEGPAPRTAPDVDRDGELRLHGDRVPGDGGSRGRGRRTSVHDDRPNSGVRRGSPTCRTRFRRDREAGPPGADPARVLQRPEEDGGDVRGDRGRAVDDARRPGDGRGRRDHRRVRARRSVHQLGRREDLPRRGGARREGSSVRLRRGDRGCS